MRLGEIFRDGMIFQRGKPVRVFGGSESGVTVKFRDTEQTCPAGKFAAEFPAEEYGGPYTLTVTGDGETVTLNDIYVGEVILFSGQSNIQFRMKEALSPEPYENDDMLRIFVSERMEAGEPFKPSDGWIKADRSTIDNWSAVAYQTGRSLRKRGVPAVGVVACSQGASVIQSWIDDRIITQSEYDFPVEKRHVDAKNPTYEQWNTYGKLYHFMLERLFPYSFGEVVWYQGESNTSFTEGVVYDKMLDMMIRNWREKFNDSELKFIVVQIADYDARQTDGWRAVQDAQLRAAEWIPGVVTVKCADVCETTMIHPITKWKLAARIASEIMEDKR